MSDLNNQNNMDLDNEITPTQNDTDNDYIIALLAQKEELESSGFNMRPQDMAQFERQFREYQENNSNVASNSNNSEANKDTENDEAIARQLQENFIREQKYYNFLQGNKQSLYPGYYQETIPVANITEYHNSELQKQFNDKYVKDKLSYEYFKQKLCSKDAQPIRKLIQEFYKDFEYKTKHVFSNPEEQSQYLRTNLERMCNLLIENPLWANSDKEEQENAISQMEKVVTKKLFNITFAPNEDKAKDVLLSNKIFKHSWVEPKHLDLPDFDPVIFEKAGNELEKMNLFKYNIDKIACIVNCSKYIEEIYKQNLSSDKESFSNDKLLPLLILIILKTNPKKLISNVKYIERYINRNYLNIGIYDFSLTNIKNAIIYIEKLSPKSFNITPEEYDTKIIEMDKKVNEKLEESSKDSKFFNDINRDNNYGGFIQSIQSIGNTIGSTIGSTIGNTFGNTIGTIGSIFGNDSSSSHKTSMSDSQYQGYFDGLDLDKTKSVNRNESTFSNNIVNSHKQSIQNRQNNENEPMTRPFMDDQYTEEEEKNLHEADEEMKAWFGISSNKNNMNEDK